VQIDLDVTARDWRFYRLCAEGVLMSAGRNHSTISLYSYDRPSSVCGSRDNSSPQTIQLPGAFENYPPEAAEHQLDSAWQQRTDPRV
jgi:hypothetical protein